MDKAFAYTMTSNFYAEWCEKNHWTNPGIDWVTIWVDGMVAKIYNLKDTTSLHDRETQE